MSIQVDAKAFARALDRAALAIERRNTIPILGAVRIQRAGEALVLSGTNLDQQIDVTVPAEANGATLSAALPDPRMLARVLKSTGAETLALDHDGDLRKTAFAAGEFALSLDGLEPDDFPESRLSEVPAFSATLGEEAIAAIRRAAGAISTEETRYYLNGLFLHQSGAPWAYTVVATDGHRLYMADFPLPDAAGKLERGIIIPRSTVQRLLLLAGAAPIRFAYAATIGKNDVATLAPDRDPSRVGFTLGDVRLTSKLIDGAFPDYLRVVPAEAPHLATFDRAALRRAVGTMLAFAGGRGESIAMGIKLAGETAVLTRKWVGSGEARTTLPYEGDANVQFGINARYFAEVLDRYAACERVTLAFQPEYQGKEAAGPVTIVSPEDCGFKAVVMPMRI